MLPLMAAGAGLAAAGMIGTWASGAMSKTRPAEVQKFGGSDAALGKWRNDLSADQQQADDRAMAAGARGLRDYDANYQARAEQERLLREYRDVAAGKGVSVAREQQAMGLASAARTGANLAASARGGGGNVLAAQRMAQQQASGEAADAAARAMVQRGQEIENARAAEAGLAGAMRQGDLSARGQSLSEQGQFLDQTNQFLDARMSVEQQQMAAQQHAEDQRIALEEAQKARKQAFWGSLTSSGAQIGSMGLAGAGGGGSPGPATYEDTWIANGGDPRYM